LSKGHYNRLVSEHSRELLEGTVGAIARSAKEEGVDKGIRKERERIIALINSSQVGKYPDAEYIVALIKGEDK